jgi:aspartate/methionine/tyrosine aminotransferase
MVVINPGNPTGQCLNEENMKDIIKFIHKNKLLLMADEVYQENVYAENSRFTSFRKVLLSMGPEYEDAQLISFNSISKGFFGE